MSMKIGFSIPSKNNASSNVKKRKADENAQDNKDFIVSIQGRKLESLKEEPKQGPLVVPLPEKKKVRLNKKYANLLLKKDEKETNGTNEPEMKDKEAKKGTEGLEKETKEKSLDELAAEELLKEARGEQGFIELDEDVELPMLLKHRNPDLEGIEDEQEKFRLDVDSRPEESSLHDYARVPVSKFGVGALRGMGWKPGDPVGLTNAKVVKPVEFVSQPGFRTGLGVDLVSIVPPPTHKRRLKPGEKAEDFEKKVLAPGPDGRRRHVKDIDEKLVPASRVGIRAGSKVSIVDGPHDGLSGRVVQVLSDDVMLVELEASYQEVRVRKGDLKEIRESKSNKSHSSSSSRRDSSRDGRGHSRESRDEKDRRDEREEKPRREEKGWIYSHIVVRIVSKSFKDGRYYLKKGTIVDVLTPTECTVQLLDDKRLVDVKQRHLETVLPPLGSVVKVVEGKHRGKLGVLKEKHKKESNALVEMAEDFELKTFSFDCIAQYVGEDHF